MADVANPLFDGNLTVTVGGQNVTANVLPGLSYSNTNPGGFGEAAFRLKATTWTGTYHASVVKGAAVTIVHSSQTLFSGVVTNDLSHAVIEDGQAYYDVTCAGLWWLAGQKKDFCQTWADDDPGQWYEKNTGGVFQVDTDGKVEIRFEAGQTAKNGASKSLYYWLDSGMGDSADFIDYFVGEVYANVSDKDTAAWHADISSSDTPWGTWTVEKTWDNETVSAGTPLTVIITGDTKKALRLRLYVDGAASSGTTADRYIRLSRFSVLTTSMNDYARLLTDISTANPTVITCAGHGLQTGDRINIYNSASTPSIDGWRTVTRTGDNTFTIPVNVTSGTSTDCTAWVTLRADEAMRDIAESTGLASSSSLQSGGIGNLNWGLNIRPHMSRAEAIELLAGNNAAPIDYGFWDSADFYCQERSTPTTCDYTIDATDPGIDFDVYKDVEATPDAVKVLYLFHDVDGGSSVYPDGTLRAVYRPSAPTWTDAAVAVDVWDQWADLSLTTAQANDIGDQILAWLGANAYSGTITIATPTVALGAGGTKNAAYIRAGEWVLESNLNVKLPITSVSVGVDSGVTTLGIGESRAEFMARINAVAKFWGGKRPQIASWRHNGTGRRG